MAGKRSESLAGNSQYPPREYCIPANDHNGNSARKQFRCTFGMSNEIQKIVQSKKFPWSTEGDMMRWAVWEGIKRCERMEEIPNSMYAVANTIIETARAQLEVVTFIQSLDEAEKTVRELMQRGMESEALKFLSGIKDMAAKVVEPIWKDKYNEEFEKKFGHYWKDAKRRGKVAGMMATGRREGKE